MFRIGAVGICAALHAITILAQATDALDPIARLDARIAAGEVTIRAQGRQGYLAELLTALEIPVTSQGLVFSRTSLQTDRIGPWAPRAIYFNDDVYIGAVRDSPFLEIAAIDPDGATEFYTVNQDGGARPIFQRETTTCLICHQSKVVTGGVAGVIVRSVLTDRLGYTIGALDGGSTSDHTPFDRRFGGYYVTGTHGSPGHAGNIKSPLLAHEIDRRDQYVRTYRQDDAGNLTDLSDRVKLDRFLSVDSDIVALLVLTHQAQVHNQIIQTREAAAASIPDAVRLNAAIDRLLKDMLFAGEAPLNGPVQGTTTYARDFTARGPFDDRGRSLRDFDLDNRLFANPLSFLIYSEAFDALPENVRREFYRRLDGILRATAPAPDFSHLSAADRETIRNILEATKPDFRRLAPLRAPGAINRR